jgi:hypothetical protein
VLLLNAMLTVQANQPGLAPENRLANFTDAVIRRISEQKEGVVFMLWGNFARQKKALIDQTKHVVLEAAHPSPLAGNAFQGCGHFAPAMQVAGKTQVGIYQAFCLEIVADIADIDRPFWRQRDASGKTDVVGADEEGVAIGAENLPAFEGNPVADPKRIEPTQKIVFYGHLAGRAAVLVARRAAVFFKQFAQIAHR